MSACLTNVLQKHRCSFKATATSYKNIGALNTLFNSKPLRGLSNDVDNSSRETNVKHQYHKFFEKTVIMTKK